MVLNAARDTVVIVELFQYLCPIHAMTVSIPLQLHTYDICTTSRLAVLHGLGFSA
jgi:hypothetical protein